MVRLYVANITNLPDPIEVPEIMDGLPIERQDKIRRMKQLKSRKQSLGAGLLLDSVLKEHGLSSDSLQLDEFGKPSIKGLHFNLSHSGEKVICATSDLPVGCDIEKLREEPEGVAERFFTDEEKAYLKKHNEFFRLWTMKESYIKMTGEGIRLPMCEFEIVPRGRVSVVRDGAVQDCYIKEYVIPGYCISVCAKESEFAQEIIERD